MYYLLTVLGWCLAAPADSYTPGPGSGAPVSIEGELASEKLVKKCETLLWKSMSAYTAGRHQDAVAAAHMLIRLARDADSDEIAELVRQARLLLAQVKRAQGDISGSLQQLSEIRKKMHLSGDRTEEMRCLHRLGELASSCRCWVAAIDFFVQST